MTYWNYRMPRAKKTAARDKSEEVREVGKRTPKARNTSITAATKSRKSSQSRSKSRTRRVTESKPRGRSKTRSRSRSKSKSPKRGRPRSRSRSRSGKINTVRPVSPVSPVTRSRGRSRSRKIESVVLNDLLNIIEQKKPILSYQDIIQDDFTTKESKLNEIIRRSVSRELSQEKTNLYRVPQHTSLLKNLKEVEPKNIDGMSSKDTLISHPKKGNFPSFSPPEWLTAVLGMTVFPLVVLMLHLACSRSQCTVSKFHIPRNWKYYLNLEAVEIMCAFVLAQAIFCLLPIGKRVDGPPGINGMLQYRCNGLFSSLLSVSTVAGLWHYQFPVTIVYDKLISLLISSIAVAYVLGFLLFIKGGRAPVPGLNPSGIVGNRLHQFFVGREVNPLLFGKLNTKTLLIRTCMNGMLLLNGLLALKAHEARHELSYALITCVILNALLVVDFFWFENSFPLTFEAMYQGTGCSLALNYLLYPFLPALITKYIIQHKIELPVWGLVAILIGFPIGFVIYRASSLQKAAFRKCPLNPALTQLEAISTNRGKKLLVAGWWGWVRHPNYLGTIIFHWAWASASGYSHAIPYAVPLIVTVMLMLRARRVDSFCSQRYQSSWDEYCSRVRYRIFPRVY